MRKLAITLAAATAAIGLAAPASAQFTPQPAYGYGYAQPTYGSRYGQPAYGYGYAQPTYGSRYAQPGYGYGYAQPTYGSRYAQPTNYGYGYNTASAQNLTMRVQGIRSQIRDLANRRAISWGKARSLDSQARSLERSIRSTAWNGVNPQERYSLDRRIARLEQKVMSSTYRTRYAPRRAGYRTVGYRHY